MAGMYNAASGQYAPSQYAAANDQSQYPGPPQHGSPFPTGIHHGPPAAVSSLMAANQKAFEANAYSPSAPALGMASQGMRFSTAPAMIPGSLQLPPNLNFDELKNYASTHGFALPPPPPPPALMQQYRNSPVPVPVPGPFHPPPFSNSPYSRPSLPTTPIPMSNVSTIPFPLKQQSQGQGPVKNGIPGLGTNEPTVEVEKPGADIKKKHDQVRSALKELTNAGVSYKNMIDEGVRQPVLDKLFKELGLSQVTTTAQAPSKAATAAQQLASAPAMTTAQIQLDPGLERKDRIAQLLAARKGHILTPKPVLPTPTVPATTVQEEQKPVANSTASSNLTSVPAPSLTSQQPEQPVTSVNDDADKGIETTATKDFAALPTPVREQVEQNGFSIPGLFMTDADIAAQSTAPAINVRKRNADQLDVEPQQSSAKRQASHSISPVEPAMAAPRSATQIPVRRTLTTNEPPALPHPVEGKIPEPEPAVSKSAVESRAKVNQDRLKDRMATLKADLMRKNQRKKDLQDGIPALDAEVQKTRDNLAEKHTRLATIKREITAAQAQLDSCRLEEADLIADIEKLERQLAEGESGRQQFSKELTQLNDQIVATERASIPTVSTVTSPTDEIRQPVLQPIILPQQPVTAPVQSSKSESQPGDMTVNTMPKEPVQIPTVKLPPQDHVAMADQSHSASDLDSPREDSLSSAEEGMIDESDDDRMSIDEASDAGSDGSASMSDSGSEYEPAEPDVEAVSGPEEPTEDELEEGEEYEPADPQPAPASVNGDYEPAAADIDTSEQASPTNVSDPPSIPTSPAQNISKPASTDGAADLVLPPVDTQPSTDLTRSIPASLVEPSEPASHRFVPYSSPLASLKSFRFHPKFNETVKDGYRSLTYSNRIDPRQPLCQTELQGQICTDPKCDDQHFSSMVLPDDKILVQMSSANDIADKAQRDQFLLGLKKVIAELRVQGVKEFGDVANALSKYRREWKAAQDYSF